MAVCYLWSKLQPILSGEAAGELAWHLGMVEEQKEWRRAQVGSCLEPGLAAWA